MSKTVEFKFELQDRAYVSDATDIHGVVTAMAIDVYGKRYRFAWWADGQRREEWVNEWEIERRRG